MRLRRLSALVLIIVRATLKIAWEGLTQMGWFALSVVPPRPDSDDEAPREPDPARLPPPAHPEQLAADVPLSPEESILWEELKELGR